MEDSSGDADIENRSWTWCGRGGDSGRSSLETHTTIPKTDTLWASAACLRELKAGLCNKLEGWDGVGDGREVQEGGDICIPMGDSCFDVWQKPTQYCKAIVLQLKINKLKTLPSRYNLSSKSKASFKLYIISYSSIILEVSIILGNIHSNKTKNERINEVRFLSQIKNIFSDKFRNHISIIQIKINHLGA